MNSSVVIGNPGSNRIDFWQNALTRRNLPESRLVAWADLIAGRTSLSCHVRPGDVVRIESPGRDYEVERQLLNLGAGCVETPATIDCAEDRGLIRSPRQWYRGFRAMLERIERQLADCPPHMVMNPPHDIAVMFDKRRCHERLSAAGVAVPLSLGPIDSYNELIGQMRESAVRRVFVKLAHGSSGSGVVAFEVSGDRQMGTTTVEVVEDERGLRFYNSRKVRKYTDPRTIRRIVDWLCGEGAHVEQWVPKAGMDGSAFDLRVVTIAGEPRHVVGRLSRSPITNLHLLNRRADAAAVRAHVGDRGWALIMDTARDAARCFPHSLYMGVDIVITPRFDRAFVVEVNAFGDLLPNVIDGGVDTYEAEIAALQARSLINA